MDIIEFGRRIQIIREQVLEMNQSELAEKINTTQVLLSRLERGVGGNINVIFELLSFLKKKKLQAHMIFREPFDMNLLTNNEQVQSPGEKILNVLNDLKESANRDYEKLIVLQNIFSESK